VEPEGFAEPEPEPEPEATAETIAAPEPEPEPKPRRGLLRSLGFGLSDEARREREGNPDPPENPAEAPVADPGPEPEPELEPEPEPEPPLADEPDPDAIEASPAEPVEDDAEGVVSLNHGSFEEYRSLGMSVTQAKRVITYRGRLDGYTHVDQLEQVPGFPKEFLADLKHRLTP
jgi:hypothetical protein